MKGGTYSGDEKTIGTDYTAATLVNSKLNFAIPRKTSGVFHKKTVNTTPYLTYFYIGTLNYLDHYHGISYTDTGP